MPATLLKEAKTMAAQLTACRRYLHTHAETGFQLTETVAYVTKSLKQLGYQPEKCGKSGIVASVGIGGPITMLRADMDALPITEESGLPYAADNGNMHSCGHDMHTAMLLGAAALLKRRVSTLKGTVRFMFQPAEEALAGASDMLAHGLLDKLCPQSVMMIHVMNASGLKPGTVVVPPAGISAPAADMFAIDIQGKGCHGAMPHLGVDPINIGAHVVLALQALSARETSIAEQHALTVSAFQAGDTVNVMPQEAQLMGSVRSYELKTQQFLKKRIQEISACTAKTFHASAKVRWLSGCPPLVNDDKLVQEMPPVLRQVLGDELVITSQQLSGGNARSVGSEDFAYISQRVPSLMLAIAAGGASDVPLHHPKIIFNEEALPYGAAAYAAFALAQTQSIPIEKPSV